MRPGDERVLQDLLGPDLLRTDLATRTLLNLPLPFSLSNIPSSNSLSTATSHLLPIPCSPSGASIPYPPAQVSSQQLVSGCPRSCATFWTYTPPNDCDASLPPLRRSPPVTSPLKNLFSFLSLSQLLTARNVNRACRVYADFELRFRIYLTLKRLLSHTQPFSSSTSSAPDGTEHSSVAACPIQSSTLIKLLNLTPSEIISIKHGSLSSQAPTHELLVSLLGSHPSPSPTPLSPPTYPPSYPHGSSPPYPTQKQPKTPSRSPHPPPGLLQAPLAPPHVEGLSSSFPSPSSSLLPPSFSPQPYPPPIHLTAHPTPSPYHPPLSDLAPPTSRLQDSRQLQRSRISPWSPASHSLSASASIDKLRLPDWLNVPQWDLDGWTDSRGAGGGGRIASGGGTRLARQTTRQRMDVEGFGRDGGWRRQGKGHVPVLHRCTVDKKAQVDSGGISRLRLCFLKLWNYSSKRLRASLLDSLYHSVPYSVETSIAPASSSLQSYRGGGQLLHCLYELALNRTLSSVKLTGLVKGLAPACLTGWPKRNQSCLDGFRMYSPLWHRLAWISGYNICSIRTRTKSPSCKTLTASEVDFAARTRTDLGGYGGSSDDWILALRMPGETDLDICWLEERPVGIRTASAVRTGYCGAGYEQIHNTAMKYRNTNIQNDRIGSDMVNSYETSTFCSRLRCAANNCIGEDRTPNISGRPDSNRHRRPAGGGPVVSGDTIQSVHRRLDLLPQSFLCDLMDSKDDPRLDKHTRRRNYADSRSQGRGRILDDVFEWICAVLDYTVIHGVIEPAMLQAIQKDIRKGGLLREGHSRTSDHTQAIATTARRRPGTPETPTSSVRIPSRSRVTVRSISTNPRGTARSMSRNPGRVTERRKVTGSREPSRGRSKAPLRCWK
eukprot:GHVQ01013061.1.p1 GENE.GHVQ01013061.1~~GHVQ01013061.1.p1  ORF type:complete len:890 (+),score=118.39 GHVQ01013061.1:180-2849(+)